MAQVVVVYKSEDREFVEQLVKAISLEGISVWWDKNLRAGDIWRERVTSEIERAGCIVPVLSKNAVNSDGRFRPSTNCGYSILEAEVRRAGFRRVATVLREWCKLPDFLADVHFSNLARWIPGQSDCPEFQSLIRGIRHFNSPDVLNEIIAAQREKEGLLVDELMRLRGEHQQVLARNQKLLELVQGELAAASRQLSEAARPSRLDILRAQEEQAANLLGDPRSSGEAPGETPVRSLIDRIRESFEPPAT